MLQQTIHTHEDVYEVWHPSMPNMPTSWSDMRVSVYPTGCDTCGMREADHEEKGQDVTITTETSKMDIEDYGVLHLGLCGRKLRHGERMADGSTGHPRDRI